MARQLVRALAIGAALLGAATAARAEMGRGEYLSRIMDCGGCHTPGALRGAPDVARFLGGSDVGFEIPGVGIFYPPNLTNDETGLGGWSEAQIIEAVTKGLRPDGRQLVPIMPYHAYSSLTAEDAQALASYLKTGLTPVANKTPDPVGPGETPPLPYLGPKMPE